MTQAAGVPLTLVTLVTGNSAASREAAIVRRFDPKVSSAFILEGLSSGSGALEALAEQAGFPLVRVAPACMCCIGNLTLRVHLNRLLRQHRPSSITIAVASAEHIGQLRAFLESEPYRDMLSLAPNIQADE
jgi:hypothetical protein